MHPLILCLIRLEIIRILRAIKHVLVIDFRFYCAECRYVETLNYKLIITLHILYFQYRILILMPVDRTKHFSLYYYCSCIPLGKIINYFYLNLCCRRKLETECIVYSWIINSYMKLLRILSKYKIYKEQRKSSSEYLDQTQNLHISYLFHLVSTL